MTDTTMIDRLKQFVESEMRSCSMDIGGITPEYVCRMWGGKSQRQTLKMASRNYGKTDSYDTGRDS